MIRFSLIICTCNPEPVIFQRLLNAVMKFETDSPGHELIIVDNNSSPALSENKSVQSFLTQKQNSKLVVETKAGLTAARIAGIEQAKYEWIIFFDDDNEPAIDYLKTAASAIEQYPQVGAWGPGKLNVIYQQKKETPFLKKIKWLFQHRNYDDTHIDNNSIEGSEYYPYGTGMIIKKDILDKYINKVKAGLYTMSDRSGKNLSSAGDIQILYTCLLSGYYAGSSDKIKLNHLINGKKATRKYANRLVYAVNSSQLKAYNEVFPSRAFVIKNPGNTAVIKTFLSAIRTFRLHKEKFTLPLFISKKMGELNARILASGNKRKPLLLIGYEKILRAL